MNYETLLYEQAGHVVTLTYNRPGSAQRGQPRR